MKAHRERAVTFGPRGSMAGVVTIPVAATTAKRTAILILNAGIIHHVGPNRLHVRLARAFAQRGDTVLRFDLSGIGDSDPRTDETDLGRAVQRDVADAIAFLASQHGIDDFVLCGLCSGAVNGFLYAINDTRVSGVVMIDPVAFRTMRYYVVHYARRAFNRNSWARVLGLRHVAPRNAENPAGLTDPSLPPPSPELTREEMDRGLGTLVGRGAQVLLVFSGGLDDQYNYESQFRDAFPHHARASNVCVKYFPEADHTFSNESAKDALQKLLLEWLAARFTGRQASDAAAGSRPPQSAAAAR